MGNTFWLETGYRMADSVAAQAFPDSPRGREFGSAEPTAGPVGRIRKNLAAFTAR
ncbi:MAG: hypothetical protein J0I34_23045 [Pseudonocardia sp.]|uniref:hypothetical protein n=1 Tax=unclassified Pseudonocardia TaxID=2619320 RepID=UPI001AC4D089|nr:MULTISPECIES: hypothetical protein [unclassified Pseudonocardia]MBN9111647.1 hypothetical protein [Pseudonocardia sp.]